MRRFHHPLAAHGLRHVMATDATALMSGAPLTGDWSVLRMDQYGPVHIIGFSIAMLIIGAIEMYILARILREFREAPEAAEIPREERDCEVCGKRLRPLSGTSVIVGTVERRHRKCRNG